MALGPAGGLGGAERHDQHGPGGREPALCRSLSYGSFNANEHALIGKARELYSARTAIQCSKCNYCMPCPIGVHIPANFEFFNYAHLYDDLAGARMKYQVFLSEAERASACIDCDTCEELCPQGIRISEWMPKVAELLG